MENPENLEPKTGFIVPDPIADKPGYMTSQFGLTALITLVCLVLGWFGIQQTPEQIDSYLAFAERMAAIIVPILGAVWGVVNYTNSRGKIASNSIWATASVQSATLAGIPGVGSVLGGKNWKDPQRYINIAEMIAPWTPTNIDDKILGQVSKVSEVTGDDGLTATEREVLKKLIAKMNQ